MFYTWEMFSVGLSQVQLFDKWFMESKKYLSEIKEKNWNQRIVPWHLILFVIIEQPSVCFYIALSFLGTMEQGFVLFY